MKIMFLTNMDVATFGVAEVMQHLALELRALGNDVLIYSNDPSAQASRTPRGIRCVQGPLPKPGFWSSARDLAFLRDVCVRERVDLIHTHGAYRPGFAARKLGIPYVITSHGDLAAEGSQRLKRWSVGWRLGRILRHAAAFTYFHAGMLATAETYARVAHKSTRIANGLDLEWWSEPSTPMPTPYLLAMGRFVKTKGFETLLHAQKILRERNVTMPLVLAGAGPEREAWMRLTAELGLRTSTTLEDLGDVCFPGVVVGDLKRQLFHSAQAVLFPSRLDSPEAFPMVLLEAFAAGKALVWSEIPSTTWLVPEREGIAVPPADPLAWAGAIERLLGDEPKRLEIGRRNARRAGLYEWKHIAQQYRDVYLHALKGASPCIRTVA